MSVKSVATSKFKGFVVKRKVAGKTFQEYFPLKKEGKEARAKIMAAAARRDAQLEKMQRVKKATLTKKFQGVQFRLKTEQSGTRSPVFQISIMSTKLGKVVSTTIPIESHGLTDAWQKAVDFYCVHTEIDRGSSDYVRLLRTKPTEAQFDALKQKGGDASLVNQREKTLSEGQTRAEAVGIEGQFGYVKLLGLSAETLDEVLAEVETGLSFSSFEKIRSVLDISATELADLVGITKRTLSRRKETGRLGTDESDRLLRITRVLGKAIQLFEGDVGSARSWLSKSVRGLGDRVPLELSATEVGAREVERLIERLEHGVFA